MLFVVDIGNTNIVLGLYEGEVLIKNWRIRTIEGISEDEFSIMIKNLFFYDKIKFVDISNTMISCVVPSMIPILNSFCSKYLKHNPQWVDVNLCKFMAVFIKNPEELGADRIVNSVSAYTKYKRSLIVIDFGTATTFDVISSNGEYLGGVISPGIMISSEALFCKASKLSRVDISVLPKKALGKDTCSSIQSGIILGYAGLVDGLVKKLKDEIGSVSLVISTGGLAYLMESVSETIDIVEPLLTLDGLKIIAKLLETND